MYFFIRIQNTRMFTVKQKCRYVFTNSIKYDMSRENRFLKKLMDKNESRDPLNHIINTSSSMKPKNTFSKLTTRRMNVLNKVFMKYITDIMSTGEVVPEILNRNIEISDVRITADFKLINVYWISCETEEFDIEELLRQCAFDLRHTLSQLHIIGHVPPIQFVKTKGINNLQEVERKLKTIKFDENHVSSPYPFAVHHTVSAFETSKVDKKVQNDEEDNFSVVIPVMKHNVFGLDHFQIISKIKASLNKSEKALKKQTIDNDSNLDPLSKSDIQSIPNFSTNEQNQFVKFINQRRKEQRKRIKKLSKAVSTYDVEKINNDDIDDVKDLEYYYDSSYDDVDEDEYNNHDDEAFNTKR